MHTVRLSDALVFIGLNCLIRVIMVQMDGHELKARRESMGMTQAELAEALGYGDSLNPGKKVSEWERGIYACPPMLPLALAEIKRQRKKGCRRK